MKGILVKRLESSFHAFGNTLRRFIESYERFIDMYSNGTIYISKKVNVYDLLDSDNESQLLELVEQDKAHKYDAEEFTEDFKIKLEQDLKLLTEIRALWKDVTTDPKLEQFAKEVKQNAVLKDGKLVVFTESKETGEYLNKHLSKQYPGKVLFYSS